MNYEKDIAIDPSALDVEWLDQAALAIKWGKHYAECKKELALAEEGLKVVRSELTKEATDNPDVMGDGVKPTAINIEAYYRNHPNHKAWKAKVIELQYELDIAEIVKNEFSYSRKNALENLVTLHGQQYFAGPSVPRNLSKEWEEKEKQNRSNTKVQIKRRTRNV